MLFVFFAIIVAFFMSIELFIEVAQKKGHFVESGTGKLWFIGIFATPIVVGLYVLGLPDLKDHSDAKRATTEADLPTV